MFMVRPAVIRFMVRVRMDYRYPVHDMDVGKRNQASQIRNKQCGERYTQIFPELLHHLVANIRYYTV